MAQAEIVTEGIGWIEQTGDQAELTVEFAATAPSRTEAVSELGVRLRALDTPLIAAQTMRDRSFWVQSEWQGDGVVGCRAVQTMQIVCTAVSALEELLGTLIAAEPSSLSGPRWSITDQSAARREAQRLAVADARARAEGYAGALDATLGRLVRLTEAPEYGGPQFGQRAAPAGGPGMDSSTPDIRELGLEPEPVQITIRCTTTWLLEG